MINIKIFITLRRGHYQDDFNSFVMKHLLCDTAVDQPDLFLQEELTLIFRIAV